MPKPSWKIRRRIIIIALLYCASGVGKVLIWGGSEEIATNLIYAAVGIIGSYVFGAAWDDHNLMRYGHGRRRPQAQREDIFDNEDEDVDALRRLND